MADLMKRVSSLGALNLPTMGHRRVSSNSLYEDDAGDGTPHIEIARRTMGGRVLITLVRCLLVYTLFEDGVRILRRPAAQASVLDVGICGKLEKGHRGNERVAKWRADASRGSSASSTLRTHLACWRCTRRCRARLGESCQGTKPAKPSFRRGRSPPWWS